MASNRALMALVRHSRNRVGLREPSRRPVRVDWTGGPQHDAHVKAHREVMSVLASWAPGDPMPWETDDDEVEVESLDVVNHPPPRVLWADLLGIFERALWGDRLASEFTRDHVIERRRRWWLRFATRWRPDWVG